MEYRGKYAWEPRPGLEHALSDAGWEVLTVASEALAQPGVKDDQDPRVFEYMTQHLTAGTMGRLTQEDRRVLEENRYGFALEGA